MRLPYLKWAIVIGLGIATLSIYYPHYSSKSKIDLFGVESFALAESLIKHHSLSDPFWAAPTGPSAHLGPLYPAYLAVIIGFFGHGPTAIGILMWAAAAALAIQLMVLPFLARSLGLGFWTGVLAASAWLAAGIAPTFLSEATFIAALVIAAVFFMRRSFSQELSAKQLLISGLVCGVLLLLQPVVIVILPFWLLLLHFRSQSSVRQKIALGMLPLLVVAPWTVRNFVVLHSPVLVRDNLGLELAVANNSCASYSLGTNLDSGCIITTHPNLGYEEALRVRQLGEVEYNRVRLQEAIRWIRANPRAFLSLSAQRFKAFWAPPPSLLNPWDVVIWRPWVLSSFTLLAVGGLFLMWRKNPCSAYVVGLWLLLYPVIYYFVQFCARYRYPILWASFIPGSYLLTEIARTLLGREAQKDAEADYFQPQKA